jgi:GNAT superfamily N-acetyltransferase
VSSFRIRQADLRDLHQQQATLAMTRAYARDPMGNGADLADDVQAQLIERLRLHPTTHIFLAFAQPQAIGIATCFLGFSTFVARPLLNIHDLYVVPLYRGRGVGRLLLAAVEEKARALNCCKLTLEVQEHNPALALYHHFGFTGGQYQEEAGGVLFRVKHLEGVG